jgi:GNAT superfamily N-acetyltransferase
MVTTGYSIEPLTTQTWDAFSGLVERHNGIFGGCWCTYFHPECAERGPGYEGSRVMKKQLVEAGQAHAALVVVGDEAIAWAEYGTPDELPNLHHRKQYLAEADVLPDYRITCIFVDKRHRRQGYAKVALDGALDLIAARGGGMVEGYPHEIGEKRMNNSFVYNGTRTLRGGRLRVRPLQGTEEHRHAPDGRPVLRFRRSRTPTRRVPQLGLPVVQPLPRPLRYRR